MRDRIRPLARLHASPEPRTIDQAIFDEIRSLLVSIDAGDKHAAMRLAEIIRHEARNDRNVLALARTDEPDLAPALEQLCLRRR